MDTKAAFEKWWMEPKQDEIRLSIHKSLGYSVWQASRAAIEIELPELAVDRDERLRVETSVEGAFNLGVVRSRQAITSHGIRIKGKTE